MSKAHCDSLIYTSVTVFGSFLAVIITVGIEFYKNEGVEFYDLTKNGDFLIVCVSLITNAVYNFYTYKQEVKNGWSTVCFWFSLMAFVLCLVLYVIITIIGESKSKNLFIALFSCLFLCSTVLFTYLAQYYQNINTNIVVSRNNDSKSLEDKFENVQG